MLDVQPGLQSSTQSFFFCASGHTGSLCRRLAVSLSSLPVGSCRICGRSSGSDPVVRLYFHFGSGGDSSVPVTRAGAAYWKHSCSSRGLSSLKPSNFINRPSNFINELSNFINKLSNFIDEPSNFINESSNFINEPSNVFNKSSNFINELY